jgi:mevalonate kinase
MEVEITPLTDASGNAGDAKGRISGDAPGVTVLRPDAPLLDSLFRSLETLLPPMSATGVLDRLRGGVRIISSIPQSLGYGSSAALCSAFSRAAMHLLADVGIVATEQDVWRIANAMERVFHGTPSGIDTGLATLGGIQAFYFGSSELPSATPLPSFPFAMLTGAVPREASTKQLITGLRHRLDAGDGTVKERLESLGRTAEQGIAVIKNPEADHTGEVGALASEAQEGLRSLGLSTEALERAIQAGMDSGATGGKLSGAGGGGAYYLMFRETDTAREAYTAVRSGLSKYPGSQDWPLRIFEADGGSLRRVAA